MGRPVEAPSGRKRGKTMKISKVEWLPFGLLLEIDGVEAVTDMRREFLEVGVVSLSEPEGVTLGHWEDVLGSKIITTGGRRVSVPAACEDPVVIAECRLRMAVLGFGEVVPGVKAKYGPRPVMSIAEAKEALQSGAWGFEKLLVL